MLSSWRKLSACQVVSPVARDGLRYLTKSHDRELGVILMELMLLQLRMTREQDAFSNASSCGSGRLVPASFVKARTKIQYACCWLQAVVVNNSLLGIWLRRRHEVLHRFIPLGQLPGREAVARNSEGKDRSAVTSLWLGDEIQFGPVRTSGRQQSTERGSPRKIPIFE